MKAFSDDLSSSLKVNAHLGVTTEYSFFITLISFDKIGAKTAGGE